MNLHKLVLAAAALAALPAVCHADSLLGMAGAYNLVALGTVGANGTTAIAGNIGTQADITGRIAAANMVLDGTTIGSTFQNNRSGSAGMYALVAGNGVASGTQFNINGGGNVYSSGTNGSFNLANEGGGTVTRTGPSPIDFNTLRTTLDGETLALAALTSTGQVLGTNQPGGNPQWFVLKGTSSILNIFNITAAQFASSNNPLDIVVPVGSTVIVNVGGANVTLGTGIYLNGNQESDQNNDNGNILFNFSTASNVTINGQLDGSILAPFALLSGGSQMGGTFIAAQIGQTGEVHNLEFTGTDPLPPPTAATPEPATLSLLGTGMLSMAALLKRRKSIEL